MSGTFADALSERVTIQHRAPDRDDLGGAAGAWGEGHAVWAALTPLLPGPWGVDDRPLARQRWQATMRSGVDVAPGDRVQWRGRTLAVRAVEADPVTADRLTLTLEERP